MNECIHLNSAYTSIYTNEHTCMYDCSSVVKAKRCSGNERTPGKPQYEVVVNIHTYFVWHADMSTSVHTCMYINTHTHIHTYIRTQNAQFDDLRIFNGNCNDFSAVCGGLCGQVRVVVMSQSACGPLTTCFHSK